MLNRKTKYFVALFLVVLLCVAVVGCGGSANEKPDDKSGNEQKSALRPDGVPDDFPNKNIEYIYGFGPGSVQEAYFRILADKIKEMEGWDYSLVYTFKEGASGRIGWSALANAKPDGYTIGFAPSAMLISATAEDVPYGHDKMSYIFNMMSDPGAIGVIGDSSYTSLQEIVDDAKKRPNEITFGVTSTIGQEGLTLKLIEKAANVKFKVIAFDGEPEVLASVVGKHIDAFCLNVTDTTSLLEDGKIKILATGGDERSSFLPDIPTYKEAGFDVHQVNMRGIAGPEGMPEPIRQYLENCFMAAAKDPEVKEQIKDMKIPLDSLKGADMESQFTAIYDSLEKLWKEDPWQ